MDVAKSDCHAVANASAVTTWKDSIHFMLPLAGVVRFSHVDGHRVHFKNELADTVAQGRAAKQHGGAAEVGAAQVPIDRGRRGEEGKRREESCPSGHGCPRAETQLTGPSPRRAKGKVVVTLAPAASVGRGSRRTNQLGHVGAHEGSCGTGWSRFAEYP